MFNINNHLVIWILIATVVAYTNIQQYRVPQQTVDVYVPNIEPGASDFAWIFRSVLMFKYGKNPYYYDGEEFMHLTDDYLLVDGRKVNVGYPPSHFIIYLPLAYITEDWKSAANIVFVINIILIILLAYVINELIHKISFTNENYKLVLWPFLILLLMGFKGTQFLFERGQGDLINSILIWTGLLNVLNKRFSTGGLLITLASVIKGYGIAVWFCMFFVALKKKVASRYLFGTMLTLLFFIVPVMHLLPDAYYILSGALQNVTLEVHSYSFRTLSAVLGVEGLAKILNLMNVMACILSIIYILVIEKKHSKDFEFWMVLTVFVLVLLPLSMGGYSYSLVILAPGYIILAATWNSLFKKGENTSVSRVMVFIYILVIEVLFFKIIIKGINTAAVANSLLLMLIVFSLAIKLYKLIQVEKHN